MVNLYIRWNKSISLHHYQFQNMVWRPIIFITSPAFSISNIDYFLLKSLNCSFDSDQFVFHLAPQPLSGNSPGHNWHLFNGRIDLLLTLLEVLKCFQALLFGHQAGARRMLGLLFLYHLLDVLILSLLVVTLDVARHLAVVLMQFHLLRFLVFFKSLLLFDEGAVVEDHFHHVVFQVIFLAILLTPSCCHFSLQ